MRNNQLTLLALGLCAVVLAPLCAADWPAFRGADRSGVSTEKGLLATWPKGGPKLLWTSEKVGLGYSNVAIVGGTLYTMGAKDKDEYVIALDDKGAELWSTKIGPVLDWKANSWSRGPNATPTVDGDLIFGLSSMGDLICVKKKTGEKVWSVNLPKDFGGEVTDGFGGFPKFGWGYSWSPLVDGDKLIIVPGGSKGLFAALNKATGAVLWQSKGATDKASYVSPVMATIADTKQYIHTTQDGVVSVAATDGAVLWTWKREDPFPDVVCPTPIVKDDLVYISAGEGGGTVGLKISAKDKKFTATVAYSENTTGNYHGGLVLVGKHVYGAREARGWMAQDFETGAVTWAANPRTLKRGGLTAADGKLYIVDEEGTVALVEASPKKFTMLGSFKLPKVSKNRKVSGKVWTHPVVADGKLYVRDQELLYCYEVK